MVKPPVTDYATYVRNPPRLCENASGYFGKRKFFYQRVPRWPNSGFALEKIPVGAQVASGYGK
jgi:hypothetical protein